MEHESNASVRSAAIKDFGRRLKKPSRQNSSTVLDQILADTEGLVALFAQSSVADVKQLCVAISSSRRHGRHQLPAYEVRQQAVEDLLRRLLPAVYGARPSGRQTDKRPLQNLYAVMLSACSAKFVEAVLDARDEANPLYRQRDIPKLLRSHRALFKKRAERQLFDAKSQYDPDARKYIDFFLDNDTGFFLDALHKQRDRKINDRHCKHYERRMSPLRLVQRLVKRSHAHKENTAVKIRCLVQLGLDILAADPDTAMKPAYSNDVELCNHALDGWKKRPELFEEVLALGMRLGLAGSSGRVPEAYLSAATHPRFPEALRPRLLQLYCLNAVKIEIGTQSVVGVDIFADSANFAALAKKPWPHEIFSHLELETRVKLLKNLEAINPDFNFLYAPTNKVSIFGLRHVMGQKNFNVDLFLTLLQRTDPAVAQRAKVTVDELRKKSATAKEQTDRATYAEAASAYAIATGDLDVYGETVVWQQRFVRDPLTVPKLFGSAVVLTQEGIELLSGLPEPNTSTVDLAACKDAITKADGILRTFYETYRIAKREPSFQSSAWSSVMALFSEVYAERVKRSAYLRDVQSTVWEGFLSAMEWMDIEFFKHIEYNVSHLISCSGPAGRAVATRDLLRIGVQRRKRYNRTPEDDLLERVSYQGLKQLADSNSPQLASDLVVQTIIDRPDASSWHRQLLSVRLLRRLRAKDAHDLLMKLAQAIGEKLEEQSYVQVVAGAVSAPSGPAAAPEYRPPIVKVTTVKYLAQLLNNAEFIPNETAIEVLVGLFQNAQHRDIRLATLESLFSLLNGMCAEAKSDWAAHPLINTILRALETGIPVVGSVNERRAPRDEDWAEAEATAGALPEISDIPQSGSVHMPPLMAAMLDTAASAQLPGLKYMQTALVKRLVVPILQTSQREHRRWLALFLAKYKAPFAVDDFPVPPVAPRALVRVLTTYYPFIDSSSALLKDLDAYVVHQIVKPDGRLAQFNALLRADVELRKRAEVQHWLRVFDDKSPSDFTDHSTMSLLQLIGSGPWATKARVDWPPAIDVLARHLGLMLDQYETYGGLWQRCLTIISSTLQGALKGSGRSAELWDAQQSLIARMSEDIRVRQKQDSHRILPSANKLRLWLLPYSTVETKSGEFVERLNSLVWDILEEDEGNILHWAKIADDICSISGMLGEGKAKANVAQEFGKLAETEARMSGLAPAANAGRQTRQAMDLIRVKVAMKLFDGCSDEKTVKALGKERLVEWCACRSGAIRESVFSWQGKARIEGDGKDVVVSVPSQDLQQAIWSLRGW
ncbi:unnamed protein product [Discula destructiva]